jgi:hypothetical protein
MSGVDPMVGETAMLGDAFLAKPFTLDQMKEALRTAAHGPRGASRRDKLAVASSA